MPYGTVEEFGTHLAQMMQLDLHRAPDPGDNLYDDWGLDSLQAFQMVIITETMANCSVPPPEIPEIYSLQDAFTYYQSILDSDT